MERNKMECTVALQICKGKQHSFPIIRLIMPPSIRFISNINRIPLIRQRKRLIWLQPFPYC